MTFAVLKQKLLNSVFVKGAVILAIGALLCKLIGAVYRVPLTNILGSEGMGLYQLIYPVFTLLLVISSSGIPNGISRLIAEKIAKGQPKYAKKIITISIVLMLVVGVLFSLLLYIFSDNIAHLQGNPLASNGYKTIAPSVLLVGLISVFRGVFQGYNVMTPTAVSQIVEQLVKLVLGLGLGYLLLVYGVEYGVAGALLGITIGELLCLVYLVLKYYISKKSLSISLSREDDLPSAFSIVKEIVKVVLPMTLASTFMPIILVVDSVLIVNLLIGAGNSVIDATSMYGLYSGVVNTVINMPVVVATAVATALIPIICSFFAQGKTIEAKAKIDSAFESIMYVSIPCFLVFLLFGGDIVRFLFPSVVESNTSVANMLMVIGSLNVILISIVQVSSAILQCVDKLWIPAFSMFVGCLTKIFIVILLIGNMGILAGMIASVVCYLIVTLINLHFLNVHSEISIAFLPKCLSITAVAIGMSYIIRFFLYPPLGEWGTILALGLGASIYLLLLWVFDIRYRLQNQ